MPVGTDDGASVVLEGRITAYTAAPIWQSAIDTLARNPNRPVVVDASRLEYVDDVGIALLFDLIRRDRPPNAQGRNPRARPEPRRAASGLRPQGLRRAGARTAANRHPRARGPGNHAADRLREGDGRVPARVRACARAGAHAARRGQVGRCARLATEAGANAVPIVLLIGFLMGVIIAFEIGLVARQFGAVIFVVNGVGVAMLRELGALMTAIVFAGRTGAAFAAQIGTQKVNEEVNAITTFGLDPIHFLVLPRLLAAMLVMPLLTVLADIVGLFGGALVMVDLRHRFPAVLQPAARSGDGGGFHARHRQGRRLWPHHRGGRLPARA